MNHKISILKSPLKYGNIAILRKEFKHEQLIPISNDIQYNNKQTNNTDHTPMTTRNHPTIKFNNYILTNFKPQTKRIHVSKEKTYKSYPIKHDSKSDSTHIPSERILQHGNNKENNSQFKKTEIGLFRLHKRNIGKANYPCNNTNNSNDHEIIISRGKLKTSSDQFNHTTYDKGHKLKSIFSLGDEMEERIIKPTTKAITSSLTQYQKNASMQTEPKHEPIKPMITPHYILIDIDNDQRRCHSCFHSNNNDTVKTSNYQVEETINNKIIITLNKHKKKQPIMNLHNNLRDYGMTQLNNRSDIHNYFTSSNWKSQRNNARILSSLNKYRISMTKNIGKFKQLYTYTEKFPFDTYSNIISNSKLKLALKMRNFAKN